MRLIFKSGRKMPTRDVGRGKQRHWLVQQWEQYNSAVQVLSAGCLLGSTRAWVLGTRGCRWSPLDFKRAEKQTNHRLGDLEPQLYCQPWHDDHGGEALQLLTLSLGKGGPHGPHDPRKTLRTSKGKLDPGSYPTPA